MKPGLWKKQNIQWVLGDACNLPFQDKSVDYVISNNVIEHITKTNWHKYASEIIRVAKKGYFVHAPNFWYPVEPHYFLPFFHWIPHLFTRPLLSAPIYLPTKANLRALFPGAIIDGLDHGLSQNIIAYKLVELERTTGV
jgi:SAM-dependent methyltransferase